MLDPERVRLEDRVALVTGAAAGIGAAVACAFARFGADVALCDRDGEGLDAVARRVEASGRRAFSARLDVRDGEAVRAFVAELTERPGRLDCLVNNAGGGFASPFVDVSEKGEDALVRENFTSVTHFVRACVPLLRAAPAGGCIVNVTSVEAHRAAPGYAIYAAMKAAVANLTRSLALELADDAIRVNCVAPDAIPTRGVGEMLPPTPLGRRGDPDDVAGAVIYLASDLARFVTGTTLHVDGGTSAAAGWRRDPSGGFRL